MGIRVHKLLGYGLTDVQCDKSENIIDPRIKADSPALSWNAPPVADYIKWLEDRNTDESIAANLELWSYREHPERRIDLDDAVVRVPEFGLPNVIVISPPTFRDWRRFDDAIDYIEETYLRKDVREPQANHVDVLRHGIYPFIGYMDKRTGENLDDKIFYWIRATNASEPMEEWELDAIARECGFHSNLEAWENVAPVVPSDVQNLATFLDLFTNDKVWLQLRPVLYTYWS